MHSNGATMHNNNNNVVHKQTAKGNAVSGEITTSGWQGHGAVLIMQIHGYCM